MSGVKQITRLMADVQPGDYLYCRRGNHWDVASNFVTRGPNNAEAGRSYSYRAYCKDCHRARNGATPAILRGAKHGGTRRALPRDPEVEAALGVLRDVRAQRKGKRGYVYLIIEDLPGGGLHYGKVGFSTNPEARVAELQTGNPRKLSLHLKMPGTEEDERRLHAKYARNNVLQEWFRITKELLLEFPVDKKKEVPAA